MTPSVAAVVLTYNRVDLLHHCLQLLQVQTRPAQEIIVVDNASQDGTGEMVREEFPGVTYMAMSENLGAAGGFAAGMELAYDHAHDWVWLIEDDSFTEPVALERCLSGLGSCGPNDKVGIIAPCRRVGDRINGGHFWRGKVVPRKIVISPLQAGLLFDVDILSLTGGGALVSRDAITSAGYLRRDYFMMCEDIEYCLRLKKLGFKILVLPEVLINHLGAGSTSSPPWRGYYQTRNHLSMVLEHSSPVELLWWFVRQVKFVLGALLYLDRKWQRISLRLLGAWHGFRGVMGRTIDPAAYS